MTNLSKTGNNATKKIKSFQYLDTEKMYSISSQIFEGLTEYVVDAKHKKSGESSTQKGEFGSGRVLADIIEESSGTTEKRFLHDYSYNLFENALVEAGRVLEINENNVETAIEDINGTSFVKVTGQVLFNDITRVVHSLTNFNDFGYAVWYITTGKNLLNEIKELKNKVDNISDRNKRSVNKARVENISSKVTSLVDEAGLRMDPELLKQMAYTLDYGYSGQFEVQLPMNSEKSKYLFSGILKRDMLKEAEELLIKKYSRETEKRFTLFGIPTQTQDTNAKLNSYQKIDEGDDVVMKQAIMNIVSQLTKLENTFSGNLSYEYVIDPIALYVEI